MNDIYDRKLSIYLTAGQDDEGKDIVKAKSFSNVRLDTTDDELSEFRDKYIALASGTHTKTLVADYRML
ncbi:MAG: DUF1659 domain-containing protein [Turicibacter sp.]|nr:DUF1659 domain-containing protein [Turicibacter sp.]